MSRRKPETVAERIEEVRHGTKPPPTRKARTTYISKDDFAAVVGVSRSRVYAWTRARNPEYPEEQHQQRLAELSGGRYEGSDFQRPRERPRQKGLEELQGEVGDNTVAIAALREAVRILLGEVVALGVKVPALPPAALPPGARGTRA